MLKRDITYTDFNDEKQTETFYFNLTKSELVEVEAGHKGGMDAFIKTIIHTEDNDALIKEFKRLILLSYGEKSADGKRFIKSDELREAFAQTAAFDELFIEIATDETKAVEFIKGIIPKDMSIEVEKADQDKPTLPPPARVSPSGD